MQYRDEGDTAWHEEPMVLVNNDKWEAQFRVGGVGRYCYTVRAWVDGFKTWSRDLAKKAAAGQDLRLELMAAEKFIAEAAKRATPADSEKLNALGARVHGLAAPMR